MSPPQVVAGWHGHLTRWHFARPVLAGRRAFAVRDWDALWDAEPRFRRIWRVSTMIWGVALLADAVIRVVMSYSLPVDVVPGLGGALYPLTFVLIQVVTNVYYQVAGLNGLLGARWLAGRGSARQHLRVQRAGRVERGADPGEQGPLGG